VIIHSTVLAPTGGACRRASAPGIDPLDVIAEHGADATRYGLLKMSSTQDVRFSYGASRRAQAREQALERQPADPREREATPRVEPRDVEERWILARLDATRAESSDLARSTSRTPCSRSTAHLRRLLRLVRRGDQAAALRRRRGRARDGARRARAAPQLLHPVMPHVTEEIWSNLPGARARLIVAPWPEPTSASRRRRRARPRAGGGRIFRRSGVLVELEGDEQRIFDAVVEAGARAGERQREAERERLAKEIARAEGCSRTSASSRTRRETSSRRAREARALPARARCPRRLTTRWIESLSPWPEEFGLGRMRALLASSATRRRVPAVHVVGTNGKTTTTRMSRRCSRPRA
jgi:isoleucyl-tRNA synthetase